MNFGGFGKSLSNFTSVMMRFLGLQKSNFQGSSIVGSPHRWGQWGSWTPSLKYTENIRKSCNQSEIHYFHWGCQKKIRDQGPFRSLPLLTCTIRWHGAFLGGTFQASLIELCRSFPWGNHGFSRSILVYPYTAIMAIIRLSTHCSSFTCVYIYIYTYIYLYIYSSDVAIVWL